MKNVVILIGLVAFILLATASCNPAYCDNTSDKSVLTAQEEHAPAAETGATGAKTDSAADNRAKFLIVSAIAAAMAIGLASSITGLAQGNAVGKAMEAIGRNPEAQSKIVPTLVLGLAFIESLALYALLISLALLFFNPLLPKL